MIIGESADIQADVQVGTLILSGRFKGNIKAKLRVELRAPARLEGTIEKPALAVEDGVLLNGTITMIIGENASESKHDEAGIKKSS